MSKICISHPTGLLKGRITLPPSKSISNRLLIINALSNDKITIHNISSSDDTKILHDLLIKKVDVYDVGHAGTAMRFLTSYLAFQKGTQILTGSNRMKKRPIGPLVNALNHIGARIEYLQNLGYPPIVMHSPNSEYAPEVDINAEISSQFISSLVMVAPTLSKGLTINLLGNSVSTSYIRMTLAIMSDFGIQSQFTDNMIKISHQTYQGGSMTVENDWSAAGFYLGMAALSRECNILLEGIQSESSQGDRVAMQIFENFGVKCTNEQDGIRVSKITKFDAAPLAYNFNECPDLVQCTVLTACGLGLTLSVSGIETLFIKETDRMSALKNELAKVGVSLQYDDNSALVTGKAQAKEKVCFSTYDDHRMAMALAILAIQFPIIVENPEVVSKSYPKFWSDLESLGFEIKVQ
ncbi:MAG: 3-phosphoshikimate 1-carboxyvinyltransferase [Saprospiraceae bacterium]